MIYKNSWSQKPKHDFHFQTIKNQYQFSENEIRNWRFPKFRIDLKIDETKKSEFESKTKSTISKLQNRSEILWNLKSWNRFINDDSYSFLDPKAKHGLDWRNQNNESTTSKIQNRLKAKSKSETDDIMIWKTISEPARNWWASKILSNGGAALAPRLSVPRWSPSLPRWPPLSLPLPGLPRRPYWPMLPRWASLARSPQLTRPGPHLQWASLARSLARRNGLPWTCPCQDSLVPTDLDPSWLTRWASLARSLAATHQELAFLMPSSLLWASLARRNSPRASLPHALVPTVCFARSLAVDLASLMPPSLLRASLARSLARRSSPRVLRRTGEAASERNGGVHLPSIKPAPVHVFQNFAILRAIWKNAIEMAHGHDLDALGRLAQPLVIFSISCGRS